MSLSYGSSTYLTVHGERLEALEPQFQLVLARSARNWQPNMKGRVQLEEVLNRLPFALSPSLPQLRWIVENTN